MDDHAITEPDVLARLEVRLPFCGLVVEEVADAERIDRVQPVSA